MPTTPPSSGERTPGARAAAPPRVGARLGDYVLEQELGRGGMGAVFVGRHAVVGARRAIKVLSGHGTPGGRERFDREARALAKIDKHPAIVDIHEAGVDGGVPFLVLELVEGTDLERALEQGPLPVAQVLSIGAAVADALAHMHARGVLHRDLKPANVLLRRDGAPVVTDFGVARDEREERMTVTGALVGSPHHMAPEQVGGEQGRVGPWTDVFALGGLLHILATGEVPFPGDSLPELAAAICSRPPSPLRALRPDAPADLEALVLAALEKAPEARPTAAAVRDALRAIARGAPTGLAAAQGAGRRRAGLAAAGLAAAAAALGLGAAAGRARALAALVEAERWAAATLDPWALGVVDDAPCPVPADELRRRRGAVADARAWLASDERARAEAVQDGLLAALAADGSAAGPPAGSLRHVCDARFLLALGDPAGALARAERAVALDPGCAPARLLELRLRAEVDPRAFVARARRLTRADERAAARRLAGPALARLQAQVLASPGRAAQDGQVRLELERLAEEARALEVPLEALAAPKVAALEAAAPAWGDLLEQVARRGAELEALRRLGALLAAAPAVRPGPALAARLEGLLAGLLRAAQARQDAAAERRALERLLAAEAVATYELDPERPCPPGLEPLLETRLSVDQGGWRGEPLAELTLAGLRAGTPFNCRALVGRLDPAALAAFERWRGERPRSLAVRYALAVRRISDAQGRLTAATIDPLVEPGLQRDLARRHQADALVRVATWRQGQAQLEDDPARARALADEALAVARRAQALAYFGDDLSEAFAVEVAMLDRLGRPDEALERLHEAQRVFEARVRLGAEGALIDTERRELVELLLLEADRDLRAGRHDAALRLLDRAEVVQRETTAGSVLDVLAARARTLRLKGDLDAARAALTDPAGVTGHVAYASEAIRIELAQGRREAARALFERARAALRRPDDLAEVQAELEAARPAKAGAPPVAR